jgi:dienelactone hydrolase
MLQKITAPTLVLHGADDPLVPLAAGRDTAANIAGARLEVVEGMGHDFPATLLARLALRIAEHCHAARPTAPPVTEAEIAPPASADTAAPVVPAKAPATTASPSPAGIAPGPTA